MLPHCITMSNDMRTCFEEYLRDAFKMQINMENEAHAYSCVIFQIHRKWIFCVKFLVDPLRYVYFVICIVLQIKCSVHFQCGKFSSSWLNFKLGLCANH